MKIIKKIAVTTLIMSLLSSGAITNATKYTDEDLNRTKWSEIDYTKLSDTWRKPSDRIQINNLFTRYTTHPLDFDFSENSLIDGYQKSYWQISWLKETARIIASDLDPNNESILNDFGWTKADVYDRLIMSARYDIASYASGWGMMGIFNNVYDIFDNNQRITDKIFAHFKASKLRADLAKSELIKLNGKLTQEQEHNYEAVVKYYEIVERVYNGQFDKNYLPKVVIEDGFRMPPGI